VFSFDLDPQSHTSRDDPQQVSFHLLSQIGLLATQGVETRLPVVDQTIRGIRVGRIVYDFDLVKVPDNAGDFSGRATQYECEFNDFLFVDRLAATTDPQNEGATQTPTLIPNLWQNQVGDFSVGTDSNPSGSGAAASLFGLPSKILYRRWGTFQRQQINQSAWSSADSAGIALASMSAPASLRSQQPVHYAAKKLRLGITLRDDEALFCGVNGITHSPNTSQEDVFALFLNWIVSYRAFR